MATFDRYNKVTTVTFVLLVTPSINMITDYLILMFGDNPNIRNLLCYLASAEEFDNALMPYAKPMTWSCGGFLGIGEKEYIIHCPFDSNLFTLLEQGQKLDLYEHIREFVHKYSVSIKIMIELFNKTLRLRSDPIARLSFFNHLYSEGSRIIINFIYLCLSNIDIKQIEQLFNNAFTALSSLEQDIIESLQNLRQHPIDEADYSASHRDDKGQSPYLRSSRLRPTVNSASAQSNHPDTRRSLNPNNDNKINLRSNRRRRRAEPYSSPSL